MAAVTKPTSRLRGQRKLVRREWRADLYRMTITVFWIIDLGIPVMVYGSTENNGSEAIAVALVQKQGLNL